MAHFENDPVAQQTTWVAQEPEKGSNIRSHRIDASQADSWRFVPTAAMKFFTLTFGLFGGAGIILGLMVLGRLGWWAPAIAFGLGTLFLSSAIVMFKRLERPVFDRAAGRFRPTAREQGVPLADLHAIQLVPHRIGPESERAGYWSCELNLVHADASRTRVLSHGDLIAMRSDAQELGRYLDVPVWDRTAPS